MISQLQGKIVSNNGREAVVMTPGGVGYRVALSPGAVKLCSVGSEVIVDTYLVVREDALELYGFASQNEKELFKNCLSVSGVGPRTALHILELGSVEEITLAIGRGDVDYLTKVSGIGKKTAERLVVDLQSKVQKQKLQTGQGEVVGDALGEIMDALVSLGYSTLQAREVVKKLDPMGKKSEELLREALRMIK